MPLLPFITDEKVFFRKKNIYEILCIPVSDSLSCDLQEEERIRSHKQTTALRVKQEPTHAADAIDLMDLSKNVEVDAGQLTASNEVNVGQLTTTNNVDDGQLTTSIDVGHYLHITGERPLSTLGEHSSHLQQQTSHKVVCNEDPFQEIQHSTDIDCQKQAAESQVSDVNAVNNIQPFSATDKAPSSKPSHRQSPSGQICKRLLLQQSVLPAKLTSGH